MGSSSSKDAYTPLHPKRNVLTIQRSHREPVHAGLCLIERFKAAGSTTEWIPHHHKGKVTEKHFIPRCGVLFNKSLRQMHVYDEDLIDLDSILAKAGLKKRKGSTSSQEEDDFEQDLALFAKHEDTNRSKAIRLFHSDNCQNLLYMKNCQAAGIHPAESERYLSIALCMLVVSSDGKLLITKRCSNMIFGNAWVLPGGHLDPNETLQEGVLREVLEETGVKINLKSNEELHPFMMFESATGVAKETKVIRSGHLILFYRIQLPVPAAEIKVKAQWSEVQVLAWLTERDLEYLFSKKDFKDGAVNPYQIVGINPSGEEVDLNIEELKPSYPNEMMSGISKAHNIAIQQSYWGE